MTIHVRLSPKGIKQAQKELEAYRAQLQKRLELFVKRLSEEGLNVARARFKAAEYDGTKDVSVDVNQDGTHAEIIASGKSVLFIEFGAGTTYPEHPSGMFKHGEYGRGQGDSSKYPKGWVYKGEQGTGGRYLRDGVYRTKGNPPAMAMWAATEEMAAKITSIWREVMQS